MNDEPFPTRVDVTFKPGGRGTTVRFVHSGFGNGRGWEEARGWHVAAWSNGTGSCVSTSGRRRSSGLRSRSAAGRRG